MSVACLLYNARTSMLCVHVRACVGYVRACVRAYDSTYACACVHAHVCARVYLRKRTPVCASESIIAVARMFVRACICEGVFLCA